MENSNSSKFNSLNHRIIENYKHLRRRSSIASCLFFVLFCLCCFLLYTTLFHNTNYNDAMKQYDSQISELNAQREGILDGTIQPNTVDFDETLSNNLNNLKEYSSSDDNYEVKIKDTRTVMTINRNNTFVSDNANILNTETKRHIYNLNKQLAASTNGAQLMVVTVKSLDGESIESFANTIFNQLKIGSAEENNGILYLIALEDREFRLEVGYGLEGSITDGVASDIIDDDDVVSLFKDKQYNEAVTQVTNNVFDLMNSKTALVDSEIARVKSSSNSANLFHTLRIVGSIVVGIVSILLIVLLLISRRGLKGYYLDYKSKLSQSESFAKSTITHHELFYLYKSGIFLAFTLSGLHRAITRGKLLSKPGAKAQSLGRVLIGDTLYSSNGSILTTAYLMSNYNSSNWSNDSDSSGGGGSWGSFGGGSSGGGGASGGW